MSEHTHATFAPAAKTSASSTPAPSGVLQRKCACGGSGSSHGECEECKKKAISLQRFSSAHAQSSAAPPIVHDVLRSPGQPLDAETRAFFEPRFGHDFGRVRVHTDAKAAESARAVDALAYTVGRDIVFDSQSYAPRSAVGQRLLSHELAHVIQQEFTPVDNRASLHMGPTNSTLEQEADRVAAGATAGGGYPLVASSTGSRLRATSSVLQRQCACGQHRTSGAGCEPCKKVKMSLQASTLNAGQIPLNFRPDGVIQNGLSEPVASQLVGLFANELLRTIRDSQEGLPRLETTPANRKTYQDGSRRRVQHSATTAGTSPARTSSIRALNAELLGQKWGSRLSEVLTNHSPHRASNAFDHPPGKGSAPAIAEVENPGDSDVPTLTAVNGKTGCHVPLGLPWLIVTNPRCTAKCTLLHESTHFWDISPCCVRAGIAWRAAPAAGKAAVLSSWASWIGTNRDFFECRAYRVSQTCGKALSKVLLCFAPESVVRGLLMAAGGVAGAVIGSQVLGGAGAVAGGTAGLAGGPTAPVTVPAGASAGFISGELLGFLGGGLVGILAGAAAEELRRRCCNSDIPNYLRTAASKIGRHCTAGGAATRCPF